MVNSNIIILGYIEKGTGPHQSNMVYSVWYIVWMELYQH